VVTGTTDALTVVTSWSPLHTLWNLSSNSSRDKETTDPFRGSWLILRPARRIIPRGKGSHFMAWHALRMVRSKSNQEGGFLMPMRLHRGTCTYLLPGGFFLSLAFMASVRSYMDSLITRDLDTELVGLDVGPRAHPKFCLPKNDKVLTKSHSGISFKLVLDLCCPWSRCFTLRFGFIFSFSSARIVGGPCPTIPLTLCYTGSFVR